MTGVPAPDRTTLLQHLAGAGAGGRAESEPQAQLKSRFHPVAEHVRALDPDVVLVVGPRGSGKSELFRAAFDAELYSTIRRRAPDARLPDLGRAKTAWVKAYPAGRESFEVYGLKRFLEAQGRRPDDTRTLWLAYLIRSVARRLGDDDRQRFSQLLQKQGGDPGGCCEALSGLEEQGIAVLDRLDEQLEAAQEFVFLGYDELDTLGGGDWDAMAAAIRGLVAVWATYARRWRRIRPKIFLRTDLFERYATAGGAELAKLAAGRVDLVWSDRALYAMLLKRMANSSADLLKYIQAARPPIDWHDDSVLGSVPVVARWEDARPVITRMVGPYMGKGVKKGHVHRWLLDHVRDGRGRALPRPLVELVETAARRELAARTAPRVPRILQPASLRRALDDVSLQHFGYVKDEWPWLGWVKERVNGQEVPWQNQREVERLFARDLGAAEGTAPDAPPRPPFTDPRDLVDYLLEIGVLRRRPDGRTDAPDLFLAGLGLRRKGGVRRG